MSIIRFEKDQSIHNCKLTKISEHIVELELENKIKQSVLKSGFVTLNEHNNSVQGKYLDFTTVYQSYEDSNVHYKLSNDNSIYVEPEPISEPEPYVPTPEELDIMLRQNKLSKIELSKSMLVEFLKTNPVFSSAHGNIEGIYSVTSDKQSLMMNQYMTYQIEKKVNPDAKLTWNETGKSCEEWTEEEFLQLILEVKEYVYPLVSYQQHIEENITACTTQDELDNIIIDYYSVEK